MRKSMFNGYLVVDLTKYDYNAIIDTGVEVPGLYENIKRTSKPIALRAFDIDGIVFTAYPTVSLISNDPQNIHFQLVTHQSTEGTVSPLTYNIGSDDIVTVI